MYTIHTMDIWNLSVHGLTEGGGLNKKVYIALNAPNFVSKKDCKDWQARVIRYIEENGKEEDSGEGYIVEYVPEGVMELQTECDANEDILFVIKQPSVFDDDTGLEMFEDLEVPGNYTILVVDDFTAFARIGLNETKMDVADDAFRMFKYFLLIVFGVCFSMAALKLNPNSVLGM